MSKFQIDAPVRDLIERSKLSDSAKTILYDRKWISSVELRTLLKADPSNTNAATILKNLSFHFDSPAKQEQTPEFKAQMGRLRVLQAESEYQDMVNRGQESIYSGSVIRKKLGEETHDVSPAKFHKEVKEKMVTIVNVFVTCGSVSFAVWYWTKSSMTVSTSTRVFLSLFFGLLTLIAEVVVYNSYLRRMEMAKRAEQKKKEVKKVIESITISKKADKTD